MAEFERFHLVKQDKSEGGKIDTEVPLYSPDKIQQMREESMRDLAETIREMNLTPDEIDNIKKGLEETRGSQVWH